MSTLATNKLGTLSGSADMNLPSSRPSSTESAMLDSNGNLTFGAGDTKVDYVNPLDDSTKVVKVLVNHQSVKAGTDIPSSTMIQSGQSVGYYGFTMGYPTASSSMQTNYLFDGNVRGYQVDWSCGALGPNSETVAFVPLNKSGDYLFQSNQANQVQLRWYGPTGTSSSGTSQATYGGVHSYSGAQNCSYQRNVGEGTVSFGTVWMNTAIAGFNIHSHQWCLANDASTSYRPSDGGWDIRPSFNATPSGSTISDNDDGWPSSIPGGIYIGTNEYSAPGNAGDYCYLSATCYAIIKPTTIV